MDEPSPYSQCVSLRLDPATLTELEEEVTEYKTLSAVMNWNLNEGFKVIVKTAKTGVTADD